MLDLVKKYSIEYRLRKFLFEGKVEFFQETCQGKIFVIFFCLFVYLYFSVILLFISLFKILFSCGEKYIFTRQKSISRFWGLNNRLIERKIQFYLFAVFFFIFSRGFFISTYGWIPKFHFVEVLLISKRSMHSKKKKN